MEAVRSIPMNGYRAVSTFSGAGGASLGLRRAGFDVLWASEFVAAARDTYRANFPAVYVDDRDIRAVPASDILTATGLAVGELDLLEGSPPCASFSVAGSRHAKWGKVSDYSDTKQRTDDLFYEYIRLVDGLRPKVFVAENVAGLVKGSAIGYFKNIYRAMVNLGYKVQAQTLKAEWLGVPQARTRLIFIGVRDDLNLHPKFPAPLPYRYTIRDAIPAISDPNAPPPDPTLSLSPALAAAYDDIPMGGSSTKYFNMTRSHIDLPVPTVCTVAHNTCHPTERRLFSIKELKALCGFPDDFILTGTFRQQWERLGRAVMPPMYYHVGNVIKNDILDLATELRSDR